MHVSSIFFFSSKGAYEAPWAFPCGLAGKETTCNVGELDSIPGLGRSPGEGKGYPLQYSCLGSALIEEPSRLQSMGLRRVGHNRD